MVSEERFPLGQGVSLFKGSVVFERQYDSNKFRVKILGKIVGVIYIDSDVTMQELLEKIKGMGIKNICAIPCKIVSVGTRCILINEYVTCSLYKIEDSCKFNDLLCHIKRNKITLYGKDFRFKGIRGLKVFMECNDVFYYFRTVRLHRPLSSLSFNALSNTLVRVGTSMDNDIVKINNTLYGIAKNSITTIYFLDKPLFLLDSLKGTDNSKRSRMKGVCVFIEGLPAVITEVGELHTVIDSVLLIKPISVDSFTGYTDFLTTFLNSCKEIIDNGIEINSVYIEDLVYVVSYTLQGSTMYECLDSFLMNLYPSCFDKNKVTEIHDISYDKHLHSSSMINKLQRIRKDRFSPKVSSDYGTRYLSHYKFDTQHDRIYGSDYFVWNSESQIRDAINEYYGHDVGFTL